jgi:hypothetical protein
MPATRTSSPASRNRLRNAIVALSLSNLWFIGIWRIFNPSMADLYYIDVAPGLRDVAALVVDVLALAAVFFIGAELAGKRGGATSMLARVAFIVVLGASLWNLAVALELRSLIVTYWKVAAGKIGVLGSIGDVGIVMIGIVVAVCAGLVALLARRHLRRLVSLDAVRALPTIGVALMLIASPIGPLFAYSAIEKAIWRRDSGLFEFPSIREATPLAATRPAQARRVLWIIFDEWDYSLAFVNRPAGLTLPEIDRFRAEALSAAEAYPPGGETLTSLPSLIAGRGAFEAHATNPDTLMLGFRGERDDRDWKSMETVFSKAAARGHQTGITGFYHPFPRVFPAVNRSYWVSIPKIRQIYPERPRFGERVISYARMSTRRLPVVGDLIWPERDTYQAAAVEMYDELLESARSMASDPQLNLVLVHLPVPHLPAIYDRETDRIGVSPENDYIDNLVLMDKTFGILRSDLERAGLWESTALVVSSDHWARRESWGGAREWLGDDDYALVSQSVVDYRIPFLARAPGDSSAVEYTGPFNTVVTGALLLEILEGRVSDNRSIAAWLEGNTQDVANPYFVAQKTVRLAEGK